VNEKLAAFPDAFGWIRARLRSPSAHYLIGEAAAKGLSFITFIALARWMGATDFGLVSVYVAATGILAVLLGAGLPNAIVRFHFSELPFAEVLGTTLLGLAGTFLLVGATFTALLPYVSGYLEIPFSLLVLAIPGGAAITLRNAWLSSLRARKAAKQYAATQFAESALFIGLAALLLSRTDAGHTAAALAYSGATATIAIWGLWHWTRDPGLRIRRALIGPLLRFALPMVFHAFAMTGLATYNQVIVNQLLGAQATGIYSFGYRFGMAMLILSTAFSSAWIPDFLELVRDPNARSVIRGRAVRYANFMTAIALLMMLGLPPVARLLGGHAYAAAPSLIPLVIYAYLWFVLYTLVFAYALHAQRSIAIATATTGALVVNIALTYFLVPRLGLVGGVVASVVGYASLFSFQLSLHA
jgi:O-antigen/teichoic acid export membrane protein